MVIVRLHHGVGLCLGEPPSRCALEGSGKEFVHEPGHGLAPVTSFMVEGTDHVPRDAGHVVPGSGHGEGEDTAKDAAFKDI